MHQIRVQSSNLHYPIVNDKKLKRYDYAEVKYPKEYNIDLNGGVLGFFKKLC